MLNLLPPEIKQRQRTKSLFYSLTSIYVIILVLLGLGVAGLTTWKFVLQTEISSKQSRVDQLSSQRQGKKEVIAQAAFIEDRMKVAKQFQESRQWETMLNTVAEATPVDVELTKLALTTAESTKTLTLSVAGTTNNRRSIVLFRDKLATIENLSTVAIQSITEGPDRQFIFSLEATYKDAKKS